MTFLNISIILKADKHRSENEIEVEHQILTSDEFFYLSQNFNITTFPRYIIIDQNGKIANMEAPYPSMKQKLINELKSLLHE